KSYTASEFRPLPEWTTEREKCESPMARRVNTRFLIILTVVIVGLGGAALVVSRLKSHPNAHAHLNAGERLLKEGNYEAATGEYANAVRADPTNKELHVKLGDVANQRTGEM